MGVYVTRDWNLEKGKMVSNIPFDAYQSHENEGQGPPKNNFFFFFCLAFLGILAQW